MRPAHALKWRDCEGNPSVDAALGPFWRWLGREIARQTRFGDGQGLEGQPPVTSKEQVSARRPRAPKRGNER